jgi:hypothetical protein
LSRHLAIGKSFSKVGSRRCTYIFGYGLGTWKPNFSIFFLSFYCPYIYRIMNSYGSSGIVCTTVIKCLEKNKHKIKLINIKLKILSLTC